MTNNVKLSYIKMAGYSSLADNLNYPNNICIWKTPDGSIIYSTLDILYENLSNHEIK